MYVLFHGDNLKLNTPPVFEGALRGDDAAALGKKQKCSPSDIAETPFTPTTFQYAGLLHQKGLVYKEMERNPTLLYNLMEFFCPTGNVVMLLGKAHTQVVWNLLRSGRHVVAVEGDTELLNFLNTYVMHEINTGVHNCELYTGQSAMDHDPNRNFWFKLSSDKRVKLYKFLFLDTRPTYRTEDDYKARRHVATGMLDGYHGGSREAATKFVEKLDECYFDQGKLEVTLNIFRAHVTEEDFNPNDDEEVSEGNEEFDLDATYRKHAAAVASSSTPASSQDIIEESAEQNTTLATEVRCRGATEVRCGDTEEDFLSQLYSVMDTAPLPAGNVLAGKSTQTFVMRSSELPSPTLALGRCAEEREVSVSEQEKGAICRSLGDDVVRKLFNADEYLTVIDSSPRESSGGRMALEELSLNEDVEKPRVDSLDPSAEEVL
ncbi:hypothetical protein CBR_g4164 [Chara braunii]|uniref:Uncharacterized protein n=1 Tax=Chara braunii TaxID=69332 RepID=A0A388KHF6_CHABU|nr:hypothetical protein CBR_g4164 [Chara braunii]|eukprot:GBG69469.1 hypothetical protein CBR_g4164 [Chara braunii]